MLAWKLRLSRHMRLQTPAVRADIQDVVSMPLTSRLRPGTQRPTRRAAPSCRGGASSLLRLTQPAAPRLPSAFDVSGWVSRAASALKLTAVPSFAPSEFTAG
jgi:hypothetical protein